MKTRRLMEFEKLLKYNGFKKKWLDDKSGYWFRKKFDFPVFGKLICDVEPDNEVIFLEVRVKTKTDGTESIAKEFKVRDWPDCVDVLLDNDACAEYELLINC